MIDSRWPRVLGLLVAVDLAFVALHLALFSGGPPAPWPAAMFGLDREANLPTWYASMKLLLAGVAVLLASRSSRARSDAVHRGLAGAGMVLVFLSADEAASFHESVTYLLRPIDAFPRFSGDHGIWIPLYALAGLAALVSVRGIGTWVRTECPRAFHLVVAGGVLFVGGAVGLEILSYGALRDSANGALYAIQVAAEEGLELVGVSAMLVGSALLLLRTWAGETATWKKAVSSPRLRAPP